jgi:hypothetical protein
MARIVMLREAIEHAKERSKKTGRSFTVVRFTKSDDHSIHYFRLYPRSQCWKAMHDCPVGWGVQSAGYTYARGEYFYQESGYQEETSTDYGNDDGCPLSPVG